MQNSGLSPAEGTSWKDHHANVDRLIDHYSLHRNNAMNSIGHILVSNEANDKACVVVEERLLLRGVFLQKGRWRIGYPNVYLGSPGSLGHLRHLIVHEGTLPGESLSLYVSDTVIQRSYANVYDQSPHRVHCL